MLSHPLTNLKIQKHNQNQPKFKNVCSEIIYSKNKRSANVINLDEYKSMQTHWIAFVM